MTLYCIIEDEKGWKVVEHTDGQTAEETAHRVGGQLVDSGPYHSWEEATEAMEALQFELDEASETDTPGTQALEGRSEIEE